MQALKTPFLLLLIIVTTFSLFGCGDPVKEQIIQQTPITEQRVQQLGEALTDGQVRNASLINQYAAKVNQLKPQLAPLIAEFSKDATINGPMYKALLDRVNTAKTQPLWINLPLPVHPTGGD